MIFLALAVLLGTLGILLDRGLSWHVQSQIDRRVADAEALLSRELQALAVAIRQEMGPALSAAQGLAPTPDDLPQSGPCDADVAFLDWTLADGTVLCSRHYPERFGTVDTDDPRHLPGRLTLGAETVYENFAPRQVAALQLALEVQGAGIGTRLVGGVACDEAFLERLGLLVGGTVAFAGDEPLPADLNGALLVNGQAVFALAGLEALAGGGLVAMLPVASLMAIVPQFRLFALVAGGVSLLVALVLGRLLAGRVLRPMARLTEGIASLERRAFTSLPEDRRSREISAVIEAFNRMAEHLRQSEADLLRAERHAAWRDVARKIAHEIKNPLFPIQLAMQNLQLSHRSGDASFPEMLEEGTETVLAQVKRLNRIVSEFSAFARMPAPELAPGDLSEVLRQAMGLYTGYPDLVVDVETPSEAVTVAMDRDQLTQVFINLAKNAAEAMEHKGRLVVRLTVEGCEARITFADTGPGFPEEMLARAFAPYATTKRTGSGLGLAIVERIVVDHGGRVSAANGEAGGAVITLRLPLATGKSTVQEPRSSHEALS